MRLYEFAGVQVEPEHHGGTILMELMGDEMPEVDVVALDLRDAEPFVAAVAEELCQCLDADFPGQARGRECATKYQTGFDAGIQEAKKVLRHPNVRAAVQAQVLAALYLSDQSKVAPGAGEKCERCKGTGFKTSSVGPHPFFNTDLKCESCGGSGTRAGGSK